MNVQQFLEEMKKLQENLLIYLEDESTNIDETLQSLSKIIDEIKIHEDQHKLMSFLHLLVKIANNHHRNPNFFEKIDKVLAIFQDDIKKYYSNTEIFNTFKSNKRILHKLLEQKIMVFDEYIAKKIIKGKYVKSHYPEYFLPEIRLFKNEKWFPKEEAYDCLSQELIDKINKEELPDDFYENRQTGENESLICKFIRNDSVIEFITYVTKNILSLNSEISPSIYETNHFLIKNNDNELTLIKYATFFGSIQIFQYLRMNGVELTPSLWLFAIHGKNADIIHLLEENHINPTDTNNSWSFDRELEIDPYSECNKESIKCHHIDISNYIQTNLMQKEKLENNFIQNIKNYNFSFIQSDLINEKSFCGICEYGYYSIANHLLKNNDIDINKILIEFQ